MNRILTAVALAAFATPLHADPGDDARRYLQRIGALDDQGPRISAVIVTADPRQAAAAAKASTALPLGGRTVLVKDNIETREWATTAGSLALTDNRTGRDAP